MTLVTRQKPPVRNKKVSGHHHRHNKHYFKPYLPYLPLLVVVGLGLLLNSAWPSRHSVLGYATDMSVQSLLNGTNAQRVDNQETALNLNGQLDAAAQAKANDMAARNYWSHDTPDGKTPWTFITAAGYSYQLAGENLAYGFDTSGATITGWMNSAEHRANILNAGYKDVGFGIANSANYQGSGPETIVVAMYGAPTNNTTVAAATAFQAPPSEPVPAQAVASSPAPSPAAAQPSASAPATTDTGVTAFKKATPSTLEPASVPVARIQLLTSGQAPWSVFAISLLSSLAVVIFILRHGLYWRRALVKGETFVMRHPLLDVLIVVVATLGIVLTRSAGVIR